METNIVNKEDTPCYDLLVHRILVVEDDPRTAETTKLYLERTEVRKHTAPAQPALIATVFGCGYQCLGKRHDD